MDATVKMILGSFADGVENYKRSLGEDNAVWMKAAACLAELNAIGEAAADIMEFSNKSAALMPEMSKWLGELANEKPVNKVVQEVPSAEKMAVGYHMSYNAIADKEKHPETCRVYERIFEIEQQADNGLQFLQRVAAEGLGIRTSAYQLMETSQNLLKEQQQVSLPQMDLYHKNMIEDMRGAKSVSEIDYHNNIRADISYYENQWDTMYLIVVYVNLSNAITSYMLARTEENRQCVENSYRFVARYFGLTYEEVMALPRIRDYFDKMLWGTIKEQMAAKGTDTPEKYFALEKDLLMICLKDRPEVEFAGEDRKMLTFFGKPYHMHRDVPALYDEVPHPDGK